MTPATLIQVAAIEGVTLGLSESGTIKATGDQPDVARWLPKIRAHKAAIIAALKVGAGSTALAANDNQAIRSWLAFIGEDDPRIIADVLGKCSSDPEALRYFLWRAEEVTPGG